jgi:hypothetical protein
MSRIVFQGEQPDRDTEEDREMLELADRKFFRWQEVSRLPEASPATRRATGGFERVISAQTCRRCCLMLLI